MFLFRSCGLRKSVLVTTQNVQIRDLCSSATKGAKFERGCLETLSNFNFHLQQCGGAGDKGVDLIGVWQLVPTSQLLEKLSIINTNDTLPNINFINPISWPLVNTVIQCKHEKIKCKPSYVRELDGVLSRFNSQSSTEIFIPTTRQSSLNTLAIPPIKIPLIGFLICSSSFSPGCLTALHSSLNPIILMIVEPVEEKESFELGYIQLNSKARFYLPNLVAGK